MASYGDDSAFTLDYFGVDKGGGLVRWSCARGSFVGEIVRGHRCGM